MKLALLGRTLSIFFHATKEINIFAENKKFTIFLELESLKFEKLRTIGFFRMEDFKRIFLECKILVAASLK